jgi:hypothetical protein
LIRLRLFENMSKATVVSTAAIRCFFILLSPY